MGVGDPAYRLREFGQRSTATEVRDDVDLESGVGTRGQPQAGDPAPGIEEGDLPESTTVQASHPVDGAYRFHQRQGQFHRQGIDRVGG